MRKPSSCQRERRPVRVSFSLDGETIYQQSLAPSGIWKDGESVIYDRIELPAGKHDLFIGMSDSDRSEGFDFEGQATIELSKGQHVVVEFDHRQKAFIFKE